MAAGVGIVGDRSVKSGSTKDAAFVLKNASSVIAAPGYGIAIAQAQRSGTPVSRTSRSTATTR